MGRGEWGQATALGVRWGVRALTGIRRRASAAHEKGTKGGSQPGGLQCRRGQWPVISGLVPWEDPRRAPEARCPPRTGWPHGPGAWRGRLRPRPPRPGRDFTGQLGRSGHRNGWAGGTAGPVPAVWGPRGGGLADVPSPRAPRRLSHVLVKRLLSALAAGTVPRTAAGSDRQARGRGRLGAVPRPPSTPPYTDADVHRLSLCPKGVTEGSGAQGGRRWTAQTRWHTQPPSLPTPSSVAKVPESCKL